ncbi:MAG TPA: phage holin family protein [Capillimicrobium sp.]|nr:phage holin family protein [Capillimicrobium sp.]
MSARDTSSSSSAPPPELADQSIPELLKRLSQETTTLVRQELELAKAEATEKGKKAGVGAGLLGGGGLLGAFAFAALTAAIIMALDLAMAGWLAALIVAVVYGAIAGVLALRGKERLQEASPPVPEQTVETVKEDARWAKTQARSVKR